MSVLIALVNLGLLLLMSLLTDGSARYFNVDKKKGQAPVTVTFTTKDLQAAGLAKKYIWTFGDGQSSTTTNTSITHTYSSAGVYTARLQYLAKTTDALSKAKDGGSIKIEVTAPQNILPTANLTCVSNVLNSLSCNAIDSADTDGAIVSYKYEWGDGTNSTYTNANAVTHAYTTSGSKTVKLIVTDNKGGVTQVEKTFILKQNSAPVASFTCQKTGIQKIHCESTSSDADETLSIFNWTLDDGANYTTASFDHTFSRPQDIAIASHNIQLQVTDSLGLVSSVSQNVAVDLEVIREAPRGYFKIFEMGTTLELHSFIAKTQFAPKRAYYQIYGASDQDLLQTIELPEFYPNTIVKADLGTYRNGRIFFTVIDWRDQVFRTSIPFSLVEDTTILKPFVEFRAIQSARRTVYLNLNLAFDFDLDFAIKSFNINFGDGQQVELTNDTFLTHTYAAAGTYQVTVTAITNHNTQATLTKAVTVTDNDLPAVTPDATFGYRIFSFAQNVSFYNEKSGTPNGEIISYLWSFGDGTTGTGATQSHFYEPGTYLVSLTVTDTAGLTNTQTQKITIKADGADLIAGIDCTLQSPYLDLVQKCKVLALDRFNEISRVRVLWGDGTVSVLGTPFDANQGIYYPTKKYTAEGVYTAKVVVNTTRGDVAGFETTLNIIARPPVASIQCYPNNLAVYCDALGSYDPKGTPLSYEFNFGNGHVETNLTGVINYAYPEAGLYDVSVKVTDAQGTSAVSTMKVQAVRPPNQLPVANFNCNSPQPYTIFCWEDGIYDPDGSIAIKKLSYDDGDYGFLNTNESTRHQFTTSGQHEVTLTVMDNDGGVTTVTKSFDVSVNNPPVASFECNTYGPQKMNCYSTSTDNDQGDRITTFNWEFGDGATQNGLASGFDHVYGANPIYSVKLTIYDQFGASSVIEKEITMLQNKAPYATIQCLPSNGSTFNCSADARDDDGYVLTKYWTIEGVKISDWSTVYNFTNGGDYPVTFTMIDDLGKMAVVSTNVYVDKAIAKFECTKVSLLKVSCDASESIDVSDRSIVYYRFEFDEAGIIEDKIATFEFSDFGVHQVSLHIINNLGVKTVLTKTIDFTKTYLAPDPKFEVDINLEGNTKLDGSPSLTRSRNVSKYEWDFGDGTTQITTSSIVNHKFSSFGYYEISLTVTDEVGAKRSVTQNTFIYDSEVQNPGPAGEVGLIGIDSDANGVRDDVQRWINFEAKDNLELKFVLNKLAQNYLISFQNKENETILKDLFKKREIIELCLKSKVPNDETLNDLTLFMEIIQFNTDQRSRQSVLMQSLVGGYLSEPINELTDYSKFCEGI